MIFKVFVFLLRESVSKETIVFSGTLFFRGQFTYQPLLHIGVIMFINMCHLILSAPLTKQLDLSFLLTVHINIVVLVVNILVNIIVLLIVQ